MISVSVSERSEPVRELQPTSPFPWRYAIVLTLLAVTGTVLTLPFSIEVAAQLPGAAEAPAPHAASVIYAITVEGLISFLLVALGLRLGRPLGLDWSLIQGWGKRRSPQLVRRTVFLAAALGVLSALVLLGLSKALPLPEVEGIQLPSWHAALLGSFGAGMREEIWFRLGVMTVLAWVLALGGRVPWRKTAFWSANVLAALLFGAIHLPQAAALGALTAPVLVWVFLGNGVVGVVCGWLYWRTGILAAMVSHAIVDIVLKVLYPLFTA